jgi:hypothetical protein
MKTKDFRGIRAIDKPIFIVSSPGALPGRTAITENAGFSRFWASDRFYFHSSIF